MEEHQSILFTMTTLGYAGSTPLSFVENLIRMIWMVLGAFFVAIQTSKMTNAFGGFDYADISKNQIIAIEGSIEAWIIKTPTLSVI